MQKVIYLLTLLGLSSMVNSHEYLVEAKIYQQDKLVDTPTLLIQENEVTEIIAKATKKDYQLNITLNEIDKNSVKVATSIRIGDQAITPEMLVNYGEEASIVIEQEKLSLIVHKVENHHH